MTRDTPGRRRERPNARTAAVPCAALGLSARWLFGRARKLRARAEDRASRDGWRRAESYETQHKEHGRDTRSRVLVAMLASPALDSAAIPEVPLPLPRVRAEPEARAPVPARVLRGEPAVPIGGRIVRRPKRPAGCGRGCRNASLGQGTGLGLRQPHCAAPCATRTRHGARRAGAHTGGEGKKQRRQQQRADESDW